MILQVFDFNGAYALLADKLAPEWEEIEQSLKSLLPDFKPSQQRGLNGTPIFDPVGTNKGIKESLEAKGWASGVPVPAEYKSFGNDVDFGKRGVLVEVQFSNYPFLINNTIRAELFHKNKAKLGSFVPEVLIVIAKTAKFPSSNSTLYYEQGCKQLELMKADHMFNIPVRMVGLFSEVGKSVPARWMGYSERTSRTVENEANANFSITDTGTRYRVTKLQ